MYRFTRHITHPYLRGFLDGDSKCRFGPFFASTQSFRGDPGWWMMTAASQTCFLCPYLLNRW